MTAIEVTLIAGIALAAAVGPALERAGPRAVAA